MARSLEARGGGMGESSQSPVRSLKRAVVSRTNALLNAVLIGREDCVNTAESNTCEKPAASSKTVTWIIVGVVLGLLLFGTLSVMLYFHLKKTKREKSEDMEDRFHMDDYGVDIMPAARSNHPTGPSKRSLDESISADDRSRSPLPGAAPRAHLNPFVSPSDDGASVRSAEGLANPRWPPKRGDSAHSQPRAPSQLNA
ncbi:hypothetical protein B0H63DRAFT_181666 [Podospora didyma]|uniref:Uncharacterized protein n=1 Tax=Podospora didyma TaxID=330526 RepID=A0AAE0NPL0_9PEZI|nr:hypothetical protein B0H63DRAFT_181666 [Podospora didyma]